MTKNIFLQITILYPVFSVRDSISWGKIYIGLEKREKQPYKDYTIRERLYTGECAGLNIFNLKIFS